MAKKIKFTYFGGMGRGELSRLILAHAGVAYEDDRITFQQWPELKPSKIVIFLFSFIKSIKSL